MDKLTSTAISVDSAGVTYLPTCISSNGDLALGISSTIVVRCQRMKWSCSSKPSAALISSTSTATSEQRRDMPSGMQPRKGKELGRARRPGRRSRSSRRKRNSTCLLRNELRRPMHLHGGAVAQCLRILQARARRSAHRSWTIRIQVFPSMPSRRRRMREEAIAAEVGKQ